MFAYQIVYNLQVQISEYQMSMCVCMAGKPVDQI